MAASAKITAFWDKAPCSFALTMDDVRTFETPVYFNEITRRYIPEGSSSN
jgi:hypothetical protein